MDLFDFAPRVRPMEAELTSGCPIGLTPAGAQSHARHLKSIVCSAAHRFPHVVGTRRGDGAQRTHDSLNDPGETERLRGSAWQGARHHDIR